MVNVKALPPATKLGLQLLAQKMAMRRAAREMMSGAPGGKPGQPASVQNPNQPTLQPGAPVPARVNPAIANAVLAQMAARGRMPGSEGPEPIMPGNPPTRPQPFRPGLPGSKVPAMQEGGTGNPSGGYYWSDPTWKNPYPQVGSNEA